MVKENSREIEVREEKMEDEIVEEEKMEEGQNPSIQE